MQIPPVPVCPHLCQVPHGPTSCHRLWDCKALRPACDLAHHAHQQTAHLLRRGRKHAALTVGAVDLYYMFACILCSSSIICHLYSDHISITAYVLYCWLSTCLTCMHSYRHTGLHSYTRVHICTHTHIQHAAHAAHAHLYNHSHVQCTHAGVTVTASCTIMLFMLYNDQTVEHKQKANMYTLPEDYCQVGGMHGQAGRRETITTSTDQTRLPFGWRV